jgi:ech hydrogenase subunit C
MDIFRNLLHHGRMKSPWFLHFDCGSCNGCDIETLACLTPRYDVERFGAVNIGNPKHADVLLVTGTVNPRNRLVLRQIFDQMPSPKAVVAVGACSLSGGVFRGAYNVVGGVHEVIPVDVSVPGCPPRPEAIIDGLLEAMAAMAAKIGRGPAPGPTLMPWDPDPGREEPASARPPDSRAAPDGNGKAPEERGTAPAPAPDASPPVAEDSGRDPDARPPDGHDQAGPGSAGTAAG